MLRSRSRNGPWVCVEWSAAKRGGCQESDVAGSTSKGSTMRPVLEGAAMLRRFVRILLVVALGTALASAALAPPAVAQEPSSITASLTGPATLIAKGTGS